MKRKFQPPNPEQSIILESFVIMHKEFGFYTSNNNEYLNFTHQIDGAHFFKSLEEAHEQRLLLPAGIKIIAEVRLITRSFTLLLP